MYICELTVDGRRSKPQFAKKWEQGREETRQGISKANKTSKQEARDKKRTGEPMQMTFSHSLLLLCAYVSAYAIFYSAFAYVIACQTIPRCVSLATSMDGGRTA